MLAATGVPDGDEPDRSEALARLGATQSRVEARLRAFFDAKRAQARALAPEGTALVDAVAGLTMRGGKRIRPALLEAAYRAVGPGRDPQAVVDAGAALELLQTYLLIHDDWMDGDAVRRGGPAVHTAFAAAHGDAHLGASLAILAGNLASAQAWELLSRAARAASAGGAEALEVFQRMHREVVVGQQLDLLGSADVSRMHQLKTGSYTVLGPLELGAVLGGATSAQRAALAAYGAPLGEAFQLRDDLLGTFGDPGRTGKPVASDLRAGRRTALLAAAENRMDAPQRCVIEAAAAPGAPQEAVVAARAVLEACGARAAVEARTRALVHDAVRALERAPLDRDGVELLCELAALFAVRSA